jgi:hypothetical protein
MAADEVVMTLFDCPDCADNRTELQRLREENAWLRRYVKIPSCIRCSQGGGLTGYLERHGYELPVCRKCWKPGERLRLAEGDEVELIDDLRARVHLRLAGGVVTIECYDTDTGWGSIDYGDGRVERFKLRTWPGWAARWRCTGAVELDDQPGAGVGTMSMAVKGVLAAARQAVSP